MEKFNKAIEAFDLANSKDPNQEKWHGKTYPKELLYSQRMSACLSEYQPNASEALQLAARSHHICRWEIPRDQFSKDKKGYHAWRNTLKKFHADKSGDILSSLDYDEQTIQKVKDLITKKHLRKDTDTQHLEDVICMVFLQFYLEDFSKHYTEEKLVDILQKTWKKMSPKGQETALKMDLPSRVSQLVSKALA